MAENTLTGLIPDIYQALNQVSREQVGMIPSVSFNASAERAAVGENVTVPVVGRANVQDVTPAMVYTEPTAQTVTGTSIVITKSREAEFGFVGEAYKGLNNGPGQMSIQADMIAEAMRSITNELEVDLCALHVSASRAYGTAATTPFASTLIDPAQVRKILVDNGAPTDRSLVIDTTAGANLRALANLNDTSYANSDSLLRQGILLPLHGFDVRESGQTENFVKGTAASATTDATGYAIGTTTITLAAVGTGTLKAGDVITFAGDTNKYVVNTAIGAVSGATLIINAPGLQTTMTAATHAITVTANSARNMAFSRGAIVAVARAPEMPDGGDSAQSSIIVSDPFSGLSFEVLRYAGKRKIKYEVALAWGVKVIKPEHVAILLG
jgi:hypothetical protein